MHRTHRSPPGWTCHLQAPGWGCGEWPADQAVSVGSHADDLAALVDELGPGRLHLLGHSHGGWIVLRYASQHPRRLRSLTLIDPEIEGFEAAQRAHILQARRSTSARSAAASQTSWKTPS